MHIRYDELSVSTDATDATTYVRKVNLWLSNNKLIYNSYGYGYNGYGYPDGEEKNHKSKKKSKKDKSSSKKKPR
jgi:hypothetical protein